MHFNIMGKHTHKQSNSVDIVNEKTSLSSKWVHKFHVLDYHRWHYVKKVLAHRKPHEGRDVIESNSKVVVDCNNDQCSKKEITENLQSEAPKTDNSSLTDKSAPTSSSPKSKSSTLVPLSPTKGSRATRIKKMIAKEVTKRRGRHRRSSTCPPNSELGRANLADQHLEIADDGILDDSKSLKFFEQDVSEGDMTCVLCCSRNIACQLNRTKKVGKDAEDDRVDQMKFLVQDVPNMSLDRLPFKGKIDRSASLHHSRDFLDSMDVLTMDVLSTDTEFLGVLNEHKSSQSRSGNRNTLKKSGTFPNIDPSCDKKTSFPSLFNLNRQKSYANANSSQSTWIEYSSNPHGDQIVGRRFKDLRQKIKHLIKENRKERQRIAMDAVLHKVPFGQKISEENAQESLCVGISETDSSVSPYNNKGKNFYRRRSPSLDESLDKYCQLFKTTSFSSRETKTSTFQSSRLRVINENSRSQQKGIARIFSSPNLDLSSINQSADHDGCITSKTPNRRIMSFSERKMEYSLNNDMESRVQFDATKETRKYSEEYIDISNTEAITSVDNDNKNAIVDQGDTTMASEVDFDDNYNENAIVDQGDTIIALELDFDDNDESVISTQYTDTIFGFHHAMDSYEHECEGALLQDDEVAESKDGSPTFSYTIVDEDAENSMIQSTTPKHHHIQVSNNEISEFNYVRDILQLSGYSRNQLLGTWYSSEQPVDPSVFIELESFSLVEPQWSSSSYKEANHVNNLVLFDVINEVLLAIYERSMSYWATPLCSGSRTHQMPKGYRVLEEVWNCISWYIGCSRPELDPSLDYITIRDLAKYDGWMNLQFDAECVGLELEDSIFDDLLTEIIS